ncbi:TPA: capsular biosynthesis protein, partial [Campylobacter jejuni]|nr:capsular biosynthesis protein [Campylobacter jejuni]
YPLFGLSGGGALSSFFQKCGLNMHYDFHRSFLKSYCLNYNLFKKNYQINILYYTEWGLDTLYREKFLSLFSKKIPIIFLVRDPISRLKTAVNHHTNNPDKDIRLFNLTLNFNKILDCKKYGTSIAGNFANIPMIEYLNFWFFTNRWFLYNSFLSSLNKFEV